MRSTVLGGSDLAPDTELKNAERDGCDCLERFAVKPPDEAVLRCCHFNGWRLALIKHGGYHVQALCPFDALSAREQDAIEDPYEHYSEADYGAALAAFHAAEERLLRGDA